MRPKLIGDAAKAVAHRGSHLQIIASAGSGKTEVVSQRVASVLADGIPASGVVAFTFTERAAAELKARISTRVEEQLGRAALDLLNGMFVGTIHSYCFRLLQQRVPEYETYDVLDENQLNAFIVREASRLGIKQLDPDDKNRLYRSVDAFLKGLDVIENELLDPASLPAPFGTIVGDYLDTLARYRLLTYGQQVVRAVAELERPDVAAAVHAELRHLIVDEYQDVNPAQERLIELLGAGPDVSVCVVGDDDQAIYQWRGSDVSNIVTFNERYPDVARFEITTNRRSVPGVIEVANAFAETIPERLDKEMKPSRKAAAGGRPVSVWSQEMEADEAGAVALGILRLHEEQAVPYRDMAVLVRGRAAFPALIDAFGTFDIPVQPDGRTGLFDQPEAIALGKALVWLVDYDWRQGWGESETITDEGLVDEVVDAFRVPPSDQKKVRKVLETWKASVSDDRPVDLVRDYYEVLDVLGVRRCDLAKPLEVNRMGTVARFSELLADYESVRRRARVDPDNLGEQVGGQDRGVWYFRNLATHVVNYASGAYEGFDGEEDFALDAVDLTTVHRSKGLEWPVVFVPSLTKQRFPSSRAGSKQAWPIPRDRFPAARYEGGDADERRLFYVAATRARDWLSLSRHDHVKSAKSRAGTSPYWAFAEATVGLDDPDDLDLPPVDIVAAHADDPLALTFSELAAFLDCGHSYRLRDLLGFQPRLAPELGYGKAVHHVLRTIAEDTRLRGKPPTSKQIDQLLDAEFFLPHANKPAHRNLKAAARALVTTYVRDHPDDLQRIWETERPFELHLDGVTVSGRADVILDHEDGVATGLAILDYKTSTSAADDYSLQLQVYADAGGREGLDVRGAYVHDLKAGTRNEPSRHAVDVAAPAITAAEVTVLDAAERIRAREFTPNPGTRCRGCDVRTVCHSAKP